MTDHERAQIEKEIQGLTAKLRWDHVSPGAHETYRIRIEALKAKLKAAEPA